MSSNAANLVFQLVSARSVKKDDGIVSTARTSASSGVCLYLNVSRATEVVEAPVFDDFVVIGACGFFATETEAIAEEPEFAADGFFVCR
jgi:hypothetical protein